MSLKSYFSQAISKDPFELKKEGRISRKRSKVLDEYLEYLDVIILIVRHLEKK